VPRYKQVAIAGQLGICPRVHSAMAMHREVTKCSLESRSSSKALTPLRTSLHFLIYCLFPTQWLLLSYIFPPSFPKVHLVSRFVCVCVRAHTHLLFRYELAVIPVQPSFH